MEKTIFTSIPVEELQSLIFESIRTALKYDDPRNLLKQNSKNNPELKRVSPSSDRRSKKIKEVFNG